MCIHNDLALQSHLSVSSAVTVKVKANMKFEKIFHVVEVSSPSFSSPGPFLTLPQQKFNKQAGTFKFTYDGTRVKPDDTPAGVRVRLSACFLLMLIFVR